MFDDVLDLAARINVAARERPAGRTPAWVKAWGWGITWPVPMLMTSPDLPRPQWPEGAKWVWGGDGDSTVMDSWLSRLSQGSHELIGNSSDSRPAQAWVSAARFLVDMKWELLEARVQAVNAVERVWVITSLELDARVDDDLAAFPDVTATRARFARQSAEQKRAIAGDVQMTLGRIPESWKSEVFSGAGSHVRSSGKW